MSFTPEQLALFQTFFPQAIRQEMRMRESNGRFVHYTSAEVAVSIIRNQRIWMRKSTTMNDFMEMQYGLGCLSAAYAGPIGRKLGEILDSIHPGFWAELNKRFSQWIPIFQNDTYLACISEHLDSEDAIGRLSMWRAYGGSTGVALVINSKAFLTPTDALKAYTSPVADLSKEQFNREFQEVVNGIEANSNLIATLPYEELMGYMFAAFRYAMLATKHPGFHEEREWRIIYSPQFEKSDRLEHEIQVIRGTPQPIYKIPLKDVPEEGLVGAEIPQLLDRLIIGPTQHPGPMAEAFIKLLEQAGVENPHDKVSVSDIPLRE